MNNDQASSSCGLVGTYLEAYSFTLADLPLTLQCLHPSELSKLRAAEQPGIIMDEKLDTTTPATNTSVSVAKVAMNEALSDVSLKSGGHILGPFS